MTNAEVLQEYGYEDVIIFTAPSFEGALIGVNTDNRAVYDYDLMVQSLMSSEQMSEEDAIDWISYNTIRSLPYQENAPIIVQTFDRGEIDD